MNKEELIKKLKKCAKNGDIEEAHIDADELLLEYINDEEIEDIYRSFEKWYA